LYKNEKEKKEPKMALSNAFFLLSSHCEKNEMMIMAH